ARRSGGRHKMSELTFRPSIGHVVGRGGSSSVGCHRRVVIMTTIGFGKSEGDGSIWNRSDLAASTIDVPNKDTNLGSSPTVARDANWGWGEVDKVVAGSGH